MAFQRPFLISLKRSDSSQKWGFGIKGGKDHEEPLVIHTVAEDSLAERCGLRQGDEVIQVGRVNVQDLSLGQVYELLARCGNKIEMFVVREDLFSPRKGKEPPVVKAVVHNPYNSPLSLYSTENIAETLAQQTEVLTEGQISAEEDEGPESLSFKEKSAVFKLLAEQASQEGAPKTQSRGVTQNTPVNKPKVAPPPPPKPKPPPEEHLYNGYDTHQQIYQQQDQQKSSSRVEYQKQTTQKVASQYQYQQEQSVPYQQSSVYQVSTQSRSPGYHSPSLDQYQSPGYHSPVSQYQQHSGYQSPTGYQQHPGYQSPTSYQQSQQVNYQQNSYQHSPQVNYQQSQQSYQQYQTSQKALNQQPGYQSPSAITYQSSAFINQDKDQRHQSSHQQTLQQQQSSQQQRQQISQQQSQQKQQQINQSHQQQARHQQPEVQKPSEVVSKAEFKIRPAPPPRNSSSKQDSDKMTALYKQQYEQHLQQQFEQQQLLMNSIEEDEKPKAHIINGNIFEHNSTSGTPITYKAPPAAPPKPHWPPPPTQNESYRNVTSQSPTGMNVACAWPPKRSTATEMPRTGFDPAAVRGQGSGRRCVWPPPSDEMRSGRNTPQSPVTGRKIQWNPSPSPPTNRRNISSHSPSRRKDLQWPPPSPTSNYDKENFPRQSPRLARKARFDDYVKEHASINVPQTYRPPPGTQHVEFY